MSEVTLEFLNKCAARRVAELALHSASGSAGTAAERAADVTALAAAEGRHLAEAPSKRAAGGGSVAPLTPAGFRSEATIQGGTALCCETCGWSATVLAAGKVFALVLASNGVDAAEHTFETREAAGRTALMVARRHGEGCGA